MGDLKFRARLGHIVILRLAWAIYIYIRPYLKTITMEAGGEKRKKKKREKKEKEI